MGENLVKHVDGTYTWEPVYGKEYALVAIPPYKYFSSSETGLWPTVIKANYFGRQEGKFIFFELYGDFLLRYESRPTAPAKRMDGRLCVHAEYAGIIPDGAERQEIINRIMQESFERNVADLASGGIDQA